MKRSSSSRRARVTMQDVAKAAGVSVATASYVLSGTKLSKVSPATQERVREAARALGHRPNRVARGLKMQRSYAIGLICSYVGFALFGPAIAKIQRILAESDFHLVLQNTSTQVEQERQTLNFLEELRVEGAIFLSTSHITGNDHLVEFAKRSPLITINRPVDPNFPGTAIMIDNYEGGRLAAEHLLQLNRRRLAFFGNHIEGPTPPHASLARLEGFRAGASEGGVPWDDVDVHLEPKGVFDAADGYRAMRRLLERADKDLPNGIYAVNDNAAAGAIRALLEAGLRVPEDVAVIGNDNLEVASRFSPTLTSISQNLEAAGELAAKTLLQILSGQKGTQSRYTIAPQLIVRESTVRDVGPFPPLTAPSGS